jgi:hypothetical protein
MPQNDDTNRTPEKETERPRTAKWRKIFLAELAKTPNVLLACLKAGIGRSAAYAHRRKYPKFAERWDDAIDDGVDCMIDEAMRRAVKGTKRGVWHQGKRVGVEREYSDTLLIFLLKAHRPEMFRDHYDVAKVADAAGKR